MKPALIPQNQVTKRSDEASDFTTHLINGPKPSPITERMKNYSNCSEILFKKHLYIMKSKQYRLYLPRII